MSVARDVQQIYCSAQTGQHSPLHGSCCPVWALQHIHRRCVLYQRIATPEHEECAYICITHNTHNNVWTLYACIWCVTSRINLKGMSLLTICTLVQHITRSSYCRSSPMMSSIIELIINYSPCCYEERRCSCISTPPHCTAAQLPMEFPFTSYCPWLLLYFQWCRNRGGSGGWRPSPIFSRARS